MLRRTAAKAFGLQQKEEPRQEEPRQEEPEGAPTASRERGAPAGKPGGKGQAKRKEAVEHLFGDLRTLLEKAIAKGVSGRASLSRPRPLAGGVGFDLEGPGGLFRFLNSLAGHIQVGRAGPSGGRGEVEPDAILSVQLRGGAYRPICKPLRFRDGAEALPVQLRTPFQFTSPRELARQYLSRLQG